MIGGRWKLDKLLGTGGMAEVYSAADPEGNRSAVKVLHPEMGRRKDVRERFLREAYVANKIAHPGAVRILEHGDGPDAYLVMELLEGEPLSLRATHSEDFTVRELLGYADQILDVLAAAHDKGVIHRDIKPDNVFISHNGQVKILDFGIARVQDDVPSDFKTRTGLALGTIPYMAPEQALGRRGQIDGRADLFALGALLFRILAGRRIHEEPSEAELLVAMATKSAPKLQAAAPGVPPAVCAIVDLALAFSKDARYPDARTMQADVRAVLAGEIPPYAIGGGVTQSRDAPTRIEAGPRESTLESRMAPGMDRSDGRIVVGVGAITSPNSPSATSFPTEPGPPASVEASGRKNSAIAMPAVGPNLTAPLAAVAEVPPSAAPLPAVAEVPPSAAPLPAPVARTPEGPRSRVAEGEGAIRTPTVVAPAGMVVPVPDAPAVPQRTPTVVAPAASEAPAVPQRTPTVVAPAVAEPPVSLGPQSRGQAPPASVTEREFRRATCTPVRPEAPPKKSRGALALVLLVGGGGLLVAALALAAIFIFGAGSSSEAATPGAASTATPSESPTTGEPQNAGDPKTTSGTNNPANSVAPVGAGSAVNPAATEASPTATATAPAAGEKPSPTSPTGTKSPSAPTPATATTTSKTQSPTPPSTATPTPTPTSTSTAPSGPGKSSEHGHGKGKNGK